MAAKEFINEVDNIKFHTSGIKNILDFPEFNSVEKARAIFQTFEEKDVLLNLLNEVSSEKIKIAIGSENKLDNMKECSIIKATYKLDKKNFGSIAIIGPTRMDYVQVTSILNGILRDVNTLLDY
jgi:heat-inducible transcriptional repressor